VPLDGLGDVGDLWPTVSLISWIGTPLWLMIETQVPALVSVPVADARASGHFAEPPVERVLAVGTAAFVAEHEVGVVPCGAGCQPLLGLALLVLRECFDGALRQDQ